MWEIVRFVERRNNETNPRVSLKWDAALALATPFVKHPELISLVIPFEMSNFSSLMEDGIPYL